MWTKFVKKKMEKTDKIWMQIIQKMVMQTTKTLTDKSSSINVIKKGEKNFQFSSPTLYLGIVLIKKQRLAFFVMQETAIEKEENWTQVIWHTAEKSKATNGVFLLTDFHSIKDTMKRENNSEVSSPTLYLGIVLKKNNVWQYFLSCRKRNLRRKITGRK